MSVNSYQLYFDGSNDHNATIDVFFDDETQVVSSVVMTATLVDTWCFLRFVDETMPFDQNWTVNANEDGSTNTFTITPANDFPGGFPLFYKLIPSERNPENMVPDMDSSPLQFECNSSNNPQRLQAVLSNAGVQFKGKLKVK